MPNDNLNSEVAFKGSFGDFIGKMFGEKYALKLMQSDGLRKVAEKLSNVPGSMTEHMATLGSLVTSSVYMGRTLQNKDLEADKRKTLAINQLLCFIVPTICAYTVNSMLANFNKGLERTYSALQSKKIALGEITKDKAEEIMAKKSNRLKGFKTLATLGTFTLIYRYATPVIITPIANWIGEKVNNKSSK